MKSSGRVIGPFDETQVEELLRSREIVVLDEIAEPFRRFRYIRDVEHFQNIVEDLKAEHTGDLDKTYTSTGTGEQTLTLTEPVTQQLLDELTDDIHIKKDRSEIVYNDVIEIPTSRGTTSSQSRYQVGSMEDSVVHQRASRASKRLWWVTISLILAVIVFVTYKKFLHIPPATTASGEDYVMEGKQAIEEGRLDVALGAFKKAYARFPENESYYHFLGPLLIQFEGQTVLGKRLLERVLQNSENFKVQSLTGIGIAELRDGQWQSAENRFNEALNLDITFLPAHINMGVLAMKKKEYLKANHYFQAAVDRGSQDGAAYLMLAQSFLELARRGDKLVYLNKTRDLLENYAETHFSYRQEALLLKAYVESLLGSLQESADSIDLALNIDPLLTSQHTQNIFIIRESVEWTQLLEYCSRVHAALAPNAHMAAFIALCYLKANKGQEAYSSSQTSLEQSPRDPLVQATSAFVMRQVGQEQSGTVALGKALEFDRGKNYELPLLLQARFYYQSGDPASASQYWKELLKRNPRSLQAHTGLAQIAFDQGKQDEFWRYLKVALKISEDYIPARSLRVRARLKGWK